MDRQIISNSFKSIQDNISSKLSIISSQDYQEDKWVYDSGSGGGITRIFSDGDIEKAGVNFSSITGKLSDDISSKVIGKGKDFYATGVSVVIHPKNPFVPTMHMNIRYLERNNQKWFGGGIDLTPYYISKNDIIDYHLKLKSLCDRYDFVNYKNFKDSCDKYFFIKHRNETRGVGGIFFDNLESNLDQTFKFVTENGKTFLDIFLPLFNNFNKKNYTNKHREFQLYRRGRYVEFNLVYDRGTLFGLETNGRIESILMSLPPYSSWKYNWKPELNSEEAKLYEFLKPTEWINFDE
ncbi:MAG: oxygen-dependent coproporphyrinogen oxidase [Candidatus Marinimicrobia bacterium]|nr:oxygen-dependent coproporphyrinogen oxidase [Candidatus Neomarinimicrobiota bacterium]|tara:strand:+ start:71 stop:952 length:882 start_codon:yes stop_codon:yes gene_type:complete